MKVLSVISAGTALAAVAEGFSLTMNGAPAGRSALAAQYKSIMSIHSGLSSGGGSRMAYPTMMPPPTDPDPEVRPPSSRDGLGEVVVVESSGGRRREIRVDLSVAGSPPEALGQILARNSVRRAQAARYCAAYLLGDDGTFEDSELQYVRNER